MALAYLAGADNWSDPSLPDCKAIQRKINEWVLWGCISYTWNDDAHAMH